MRTLDRSSPLPLWAQLLADLRARLDAGELTDEFPTDLELTTEYGVSRHTAREAVRRLQAEGVVTRERGRGTFVRSPTFEQPTGAIYSLFRSIEARGLEQRSTVLDRSVVVEWIATELPGDDDRGLLGIGTKQPVFRIRRGRAAPRARRWSGARR